MGVQGLPRGKEEAHVTDREIVMILHPNQLRAALAAGYVGVESDGKMWTQNLGPFIGHKQVIETTMITFPPRKGRKSHERH